MKKLVESSERVIRSETTGWVQEMKDAMANLYKVEEKDLPKDSKDDGSSEKAKSDDENPEEKPQEENPKPDVVED